jgi:hypothetical protein
MSINRRSKRGSGKKRSSGRKRNSGRKEISGHRLSRRDIDLYTGNKLQKTKSVWVSTSPGYIYISRDKGRAYWILSKFKRSERPKISFNDKNNSIRIGTNKIVFKSPVKYRRSKTHLQRYSS